MAFKIKVSFPMGFLYLLISLEATGQAIKFGIKVHTEYSCLVIEIDKTKSVDQY